MSAVPAEIAGIGNVMTKLRVSPSFDPLRAQIGPDEYFVFSRIDGNQTLREILLSTGLPVERAVQIVQKLRSLGAVLLPGETAPPAPAKTPAAPAAAGRASTPPHGISVSRTATPMTPMGGGKLPAKPATPAHGIPSIPTIPTIPTIPGGGPAVPRTTTPMTPMGSAKLPARPAPEPPPPSLDLDAPTNLRTFEPPSQQRSDRRGPPSQPPLPDSALDAATVRRAPAQDINVVLPNPTNAERAALAEPGELGPDDRLRLLAMSRLVAAKDPWALLGVPAGADNKTLKRAYFKLSKEVHPDRFYGKKLGTFAERLATVFEAVSRAYAQLTQPPAKSRPATNAGQQVHAEQPQTPQEYAAELFERACGLEVGGDPLGAMKLFAAAVRIDPQTKYLRRAASCGLAAEQPKSALEYAKKAQSQAPNDPSLARLLASAFKATGKYADAEEVLVMAMAIKSENDVLTAELRHDLAEVRRLMAG